jgi:Glycosyl transferase 4-like domain
MRELLLVAYYFPPLGGIGSLRAQRMALHLADYGWRVTVLTPRNGAYHRDPTLTFPEEQVVRTPSIELSRMGKQLTHAGGDDTSAATVSGVRASLRTLVRERLYFPDGQIGWYPPAVTTSVPELHRRHFDAIMSSSFPITAHLVARTLQRRRQIPWVAEYRDPWSQRLPDGRDRERALKLERAIARDAQELVTVSESWATRFAADWECAPLAVIPNGHDGLVPRRAGLDGNTLGFLGTYYPDTQDIGALWPAVRTLDGSADAITRIRFVGTLNPGLREQLATTGLMDRVEETGFVAHERATELLSECSAVIMPGPRDASGILRGHVVAKLFEYLATPLPIVYIGDPNCDAADVLRGFPGTHIVRTGNVEGATEVLRLARVEQFTRDASEFSRDALAGRLARLLDRVTA